jgi:hypothetical protein
VHRFKIDENAGFIVSTSDGGGLLVTDIESEEVVWTLHPVGLFFIYLKNPQMTAFADCTESFSATSIVMHTASMETGSFVLTVSARQSKFGVDLRVKTLMLRRRLRSLALTSSNGTHLPKQLYNIGGQVAPTNSDHGLCFHSQIYMHFDSSSLPCLWLP